MSINRCEDSPGYGAINAKEEYDSTCCRIEVVDTDSTDVEKVEAEFHLASETIEITPRSANSGTSSEVYGSPKKKEQVGGRPRSNSRVSTPKTMIIQRPLATSSSIPLPVKSSGPIKIPSFLKNAKCASRTNSAISRTTTLTNKHTLEIQFLNKNKRYVQMKKELFEKQRPILDLYQNLAQIKKRLEELGKHVKLEEVKLIPFDDLIKKQPSQNMGDGQQISMEVVQEMKSSIEEIPKMLMSICKNLLSRRTLIVELLESVTKSEVDVSQVSDKIESLKCEGQQLEQSLDAVIQEQESKISELVNNWQKLLNDKARFNANGRIDELEQKLKEEEKLREESSTVIHELHRKLEERRLSYDKSIAELNGVLQSLRDQIKKVEQDLEIERKTSVDFKTRNNTNAQNLKVMRVKITELENEKKEMENCNAELQKKIRLLQDQLKHKESQWIKEKDEMSKSLKHQENLLQKLTADKNQFETRLETVEHTKQSTEQELQCTITSLRVQLQSTQSQLDQVTNDKNEAVEKCCGFEAYLARMGADCKESMNKISCSIEWGKAVRDGRTPEADHYMQDIAKDLRIRELEDTIHEMERYRDLHSRKYEISNDETEPNKMEMVLKVQEDRVKSYQLLLEDNENKLKEKLNDLRVLEVETLRAEITQLKVRQQTIEEQNELCTPQELQRMLDDGRKKLNELMSRSIQSENKLEDYVSVIDKQKGQLTEMDNLLRYRENMANLLKASRNDLLLEKESLSRYSREVRAALAQVSDQSSKKDALIKTLQEKVALRESQLLHLEEEIRILEENLKNTNAKRYKLQETVGILEKELQKAQLKIEQACGVTNKPGLPWSLLDSVYEVVEDKPNKKVSNYCNSLMAKQNENQFQLDQYDENSLKNQHFRQTHSPVRYLRKSFRHDSENPSSLKSSEYSSNKLSYQNIEVIDDNSSIHTHCHHKANSRSLISLSMQTVDFIKTKLNFLSSINTELSEDPTVSRVETISTQINSSQTVDFDGTPHRKLNKILELTAHRYEYLQSQAEESYDDLSNLVKLAVTQKGGLKK